MIFIWQQCNEPIDHKLQVMSNIRMGDKIDSVTLHVAWISSLWKYQVPSLYIEWLEKQVKQAANLESSSSASKK